MLLSDTIKCELEPRSAVEFGYRKFLLDPFDEAQDMYRKFLLDELSVSPRLLSIKASELRKLINQDEK